MTEEEARKTRCCGPEGCGTYGNDAVMQIIQSIHGEFILPVAGQPRWCIASECQGWRWKNGAHPMLNDPPSISDRYSGWCGLAGPK